MKSEEEEGN